MDSLNRLRQAYSSDKYSTEGTKVLKILEKYLQDSHNSAVAQRKPLDWQTLPEEASKFIADSPSTIDSLTSWFLENSRLLHSPHYMGHQVPPPIPTASLFSLMVGLANQGGAVFEMGPSLAGIERTLIKRLGNLVGWKDSFDGIVTNGGTLANMTALLTARNIRYQDSWKKGILNSARTPVILTSEDSHYSISRALGVLGLGTENAIKIPVDSERRVTRNAILKTFESCEKQNQDVFCVVASSCSTGTGAFDDLKAIGEFCSKNKIWFHVDGAHGASVLFSKKHRHWVDGIENADSVTWDAHKMLFLPSLCTFLLYRKGENSFETFKQDAPYLFAGKDLNSLELMNGGLRTVECTRQALAIPFWGVWSMYGQEIFEDLIDVTADNTQKFHALLESAEDFEPLHSPQSNIQCFRYLPKSLQNANSDKISIFQQQVRKRLVDDGKFYITGTLLNGVSALRVTLMQPFIEDSHLNALLSEIRKVGKNLE